MSALSPNADICGCGPNVCQVPSRDISRPLRVSTRQSSFALASLREASRVPVFLAQLLYLLNRGTFMNIIEKSRETVEQLLARCNLPKTYEEKRQYGSTCICMRKILIVSMNASSFIRRMLSGRRPLATLLTGGERRSRRCICACSAPRRV
jgi:hypothetical protein